MSRDSEDDALESALDDEAHPADPALEDETGSGRSSRMLRFARRLMDRKELADDTRDLLYTVLNTSDKAKTEAVRMVAREVRSYLKELKLKEDLIKLATSHSLEISLRLKPLPGTEAPAAADPKPEGEGD